MTDAEINRALTEKAMGWKFVDHSPLTGKDYWGHPNGMAPTPDFLTWNGFGLLLKALVEKDMMRDVMYGQPAYQWWSVYLSGWDEPIGQAPDLRRALRDAACKAYEVR